MDVGQKAKELDTKRRRYENEAEKEFRYNYNQHTEKEYSYYIMAYQCCCEIASLYVGYPDAEKSWKRKAGYYLDIANEVRRALDVKNVINVKQPADIPNISTSKTVEQSKNEDKDEKGEFTSRNATDQVPLNVIKDWHHEKPKHTLKDVVGMDDLKENVRKNVFDNIGWEKLSQKKKMSTVQSYLFYGPYGTGKTFFVEAIISELMNRGFSYLKISGADFHQKYLGVGEKYVKAAFKEAMDSAPCIMFIDEIEKVCENRATCKDHAQRITNEFIDMFSQMVDSGKHIVFFGATNYPDRIDGGMHSRTQSRFLVPLPTEEMRKGYLESTFKNEYVLDDDLSFEYMADFTDNFGMRDMDNLVTSIKNEINSIAKEKYAAKDENGFLIASDEAIELVDKALVNGDIKISKELFDMKLEEYPLEKKTDMINSIDAFERKG